MRAASFPSQQGYYSQPYQFYYTATGRYCAYDANTGTHLIHSLSDNRWHPYYPDLVSPTQQYSQSKSRRYNGAATEYQQYEYEYQHYGSKSGGSGYPHGGQYNSGERSREHGRRGRGEDMLYSAAAAEAAQRSLMVESNINMDDYFEDEGVDVRMGERSGRSRRLAKENRRHRSRSGPPEFRSENATRKSTRETGYPADGDHRQMPHASHRHHHYHHHHGRIHLKTHGHQFGSNQAGVGYEGSDQDSGYMEDFEPSPEPRRSMPGIARWLDDTPSEFSVDDRQIPFNTKDQHEAPHYSRKARDGTSHIHHAGIRVKHQSQKPHQTERSSNDHLPYQSVYDSSKTLHRQDSGIDMSNGMADEVDIQIDIRMDGKNIMETETTYPSSGRFPQDSPRTRYISPSRSRDHSTSSQTKIHCCGADGEFDCYYTIPPCPTFPPFEEPVPEGGELIHISGTQELAAPSHLRNPQVSPTFRQADSVYTPSVAATSRSKNHFYTSPAMLPRAPSPPLSPPPNRSHRTRRSGLGVPVEHERLYTGPRWD